MLNGRHYLTYFEGSCQILRPGNRFTTRGRDPQEVVNVGTQAATALCGGLGWGLGGDVHIRMVCLSICWEIALGILWRFLEGPLEQLATTQVVWQLRIDHTRWAPNHSYFGLKLS